MEFTTPMEKLSSSNLEYLILLCGYRVTELEGKVRQQAVEQLSIATIKATIAEIDNVKELARKLIEVKKGR